MMGQKTGNNTLSWDIKVCIPHPTQNCRAIQYDSHTAYQNF